MTCATAHPYPPTREEWMQVCREHDEMTSLLTPTVITWLAHAKALRATRTPAETRGGDPICRHCGEPTPTGHWRNNGWTCDTRTAA